MVLRKGGKAMGVAAALAAAALAATPLLVPGALGMAGFGPSGIAAGSWAATLMRSYGGKVPADSLCAMLQRVGSHGLHTSTIMITEGVAAALTGMSVIFFKRADPEAVPAAAAGDLLIEELEAPFLTEEPAEIEEWAPFMTAPEPVVEEPDSPSTEKRADVEEEAASSSSNKEPPFMNNPFADQGPPVNTNPQPYMLLNPFDVEEQPSGSFHADS